MAAAYRTTATSAPMVKSPDLGMKNAVVPRRRAPTIATTAKTKYVTPIAANALSEPASAA